MKAEKPQDKYNLKFGWAMIGFGIGAIFCFVYLYALGMVCP